MEFPLNKKYYFFLFLFLSFNFIYFYVQNRRVMAFTVQIPTKTYLKKYIQWKLKTDTDVIPVSFTDQIGFGNFVVDKLSHKRNFYLSRNKEGVDKYVSTLSDSIVLDFRLYHMDNGCLIHPEQIYYINKFIHRQMVNELFCFINTQIRFYPYIVITVAIDEFFSTIGITEDDYPKENYKKLYQRNKTKYTVYNHSK